MKTSTKLRLMVSVAALLTTAMAHAQPHPGGRPGGPSPGGGAPGGGGPHVPDAGDVAGMEAARQGVGIGIGIFGKALDRAINGKPTPPPTRTVIVAPPVTTVTVPTISATIESRLIAALDRNHDGVIDEEEIQLAPLSLKKLDLNLDGILTSDEYLGVKTIIASTPVVTQPSVVAAPAAPEVVVTPIPVPAPPYNPFGYPQPHGVPPPRGPRPPRP